MARGKFVAVGDEASSRGAVEDKGKRVAHRTREAIDFDPNPRVLRGQKKAD